MALGYQSRREAPPVMKLGTILRETEKSYKARINGVVTPLILPKSQVDFFETAVENGERIGHFQIPGWLARKEGLL